jgi:N-acetylglucosaminyl-diphospho-decaprenol L-rhamnosyltransferase
MIHQLPLTENATDVLVSQEKVTLSVILVGWNNKNYLEPCLSSLYEGGFYSTFDVVVVDNGSTDGSQEMLREKFPKVRLIQNTGNVGLSRATNQGIEATDSQYVLFLNNDTIVNRQCFDQMAQFLDKNPEAGAVGGKLVNPDGTFQAGYANFSTLLEEFAIATGIGDRIWSGYPSHIDVEKPTSVDWLSSACLLVRREALNQTGLLDEQYFIYGDEADLQYRLKKNGWKIYYLPSAVTIHYGGRSMDRWKRRKMVYRGKMLFYQKNYSKVQSFLLRSLFAMFSVIKVSLWLVAFILPAKRKRAQLEIQSNVDVLKLCWNLD